MSKKTKYTYISFLILLLLVLGFFREYLFVNINYQLQQLYYQTGNFTLPPSLQFMEVFSYLQLYYGKWVLTGLFSLAYISISLLSVKLLFKEKKYLVWTLFLYFFVGFIAFLFFIYGYLFKDMENGYRLSRMFMGLIQSPFILMVLVPAFVLGKRNSDGLAG